MPDQDTPQGGARAISDLLDRTRALRAQGRYDESHALILQADLSRVSGAELIEWEHRPFFWQPVHSEGSLLTRRGPHDLAFVRTFWATTNVLENFHRNAPALPASDDHLRRILLGEQTALLSESRCLHWVVKDHHETPWGLISLTEISVRNRRAELLFGMLPGAPFGLSAFAMFSLLDFYFNAMRFNKLTSLIFEDNHPSIKGTLHLGFKIEGRFEKHLYDIKRKEFLNVLQTGLLRDDYLVGSVNPLTRRRRRPA